MYVVQVPFAYVSPHLVSSHLQAHAAVVVDSCCCVSAAHRHMSSVHTHRHTKKQYNSSTSVCANTHNKNSHINGACLTAIVTIHAHDMYLTAHESKMLKN